MKTVLSIGVLVFVACLCFEANALDRAVQNPDRDGKLVPCKSLPPKLKKDCVRYTCDAAGSVSIVGCPESAIRCESGYVEVAGSEDMTKVYPGCCPTPSCKKLLKQ